MPSPARTLLGALGLLALTGCGGPAPDLGAPPPSSASGRPAPASVGAPPASPDALRRVVERFNEGVALMDQYRPVEATAAFEEVVALAPTWRPGRRNLAVARLNGQTAEGYVRAEAELARLVTEDPGDPHAHFTLGMLLRHLGRLDEAERHFRAVLAIDPEDPAVHYQLGSLLATRDPAAARAHFERTIAAVPHHESAVYRLVGLLRGAGEAARARELMRRFQDLKQAGAGFTSGMKYGEMGRYAEIQRGLAGLSAAGTEAPSSALPDYRDVAEAAGFRAPRPGPPGRPGGLAEGVPVPLGPGLAVVDLEADGTLAVFVPGGEGGLFRNRDGRLEPLEGSGIDGRDATGAFFGDYDGDGDPDLYLTRDGPNRLYRNQGGFRFVEVTQASHTGGGAWRSTGAAWADADHDGDLDLYVANAAASGPGAPPLGGAPNALFRNDGDGSFTDVAPEAGLAGPPAASMGVLFLDLDDDRDLDLYVVDHGSPNRVFRNDRVGRYMDVSAAFPGLADAGPGLGAVSSDLDGNGLEDLLLLRGPAPPRLFRQLAAGRFLEDDAFAAAVRDLGGATGALCADLDLDGARDLVLLDAGSDQASGHRMLRNLGGGRFGAPVPLGPQAAPPAARGAVAVDLDGDGGLELLVARRGAPPQLWRAPAPAGRHWLEVVPAQSRESQLEWIDPSAIGLAVEVKAGRDIQAASLSTSGGFLSSLPRRLHFGLGSHVKADYVRLSWSDAVLQSEMEVAADQRWRIGKVKRKPSSCPILFAWNGERFTFVTDFLGVGGVGFFVSPGVYAPPDPTEDVRIPPGDLRPRAGRYLLRVTEPLEEVTYLDQLQLLAYDHPEGWEVYPDERLTGSPPFPTGAPRAVGEKIFPRAARDHRGEDVLARLLAVDRDYLEPPRDPRFVGYAADHWVELDFGDRLRGLAPGAKLGLFLHGWVEYTYSHVNYAAHQAGIPMRAPRIELPDGHGGWREVVAEVGFPAGLPRMMTFDISDLALGETGRLRLRTNMEIFWDQIFVAPEPAGPPLRRHLLRPHRAELRYLGYPREYSPDGADPTLYDYHRIDQGVPFKNLTGRFTRYGDVRALLREVDDRFVVMARGEEIALEFDAAALPPLEEGWARTFVLHSDGYCKDMDLYTAFPDTVGPMPFHAMANYPPAGPPPDPDGHERYMRIWNTRTMVGDRRPGGLTGPVGGQGE